MMSIKIEREKMGGDDSLEEEKNPDTNWNVPTISKITQVTSGSIYIEENKPI